MPETKAGSSEERSWIYKIRGLNESIDVEIFEITPSFILVELKRSYDDTVEYQKILRQVIKACCGGNCLGLGKYAAN